MDYIELRKTLDRLRVNATVTNQEFKDLLDCVCDSEALTMFKEVFKRTDHR